MMKAPGLNSRSLHIVARSDADLVRAAKAGSHKAFGDLVDRYHALVLSLWAHIELRLRDFRPGPKGALPPESGDSIRSITFNASPIGGGPFYVDNIRVIDSGGESAGLRYHP
jgi:hypothetical protein